MRNDRMPQRQPLTSESIRGEYERLGATAFYEQSGGAYRNPHEPMVALCLKLAVETWKPDLSDVLDLAAGSGEATLVLRKLGAGKVTGVDPYTADAFAERTGSAAEPFSFADIAAGAMAGRRFSLIVCSFALHLCEASRLPGLLYQLGRMSEALIIVTPHKRPEIRRAWGWEKVGEKMIERVRARMYRNCEAVGPR